MSSPDAHVYHLSPCRLLILPVLWALLVAVLLIAGFASSDPKDRDAAIVLCLFLSVVFLPIVGITWQSRLVLTPEGIAHHQFGYTVRSRWKNITALSLVPPCAGLILAEPGVTSGLLRMSMMALRNTNLSEAFGGRALEEGRFIALQPFMAHWHRGTLRADIQRWAPHLVADRQA